jgi:uncharacterized protein (TIGR03086 family)
MTGLGTPAALTAGVALLERAIGYTLGSLQLVRDDALNRPTPCADWDLGDLLRHLDTSLLVLTEAVDCGQIEPRSGAAGRQPVAAIRDRACRLLGAWTARDRPLVRIGATDLPAGIVSGTGALEIAVHGWDVARACGHDRPVPPALAADLLELAELVVVDADRPARFAPPIAWPVTAGPADQLLAFLGRYPR